MPSLRAICPKAAIFPLALSRQQKPASPKDEFCAVRRNRMRILYGAAGAAINRMEKLVSPLVDSAYNHTPCSAVVSFAHSPFTMFVESTTVARLAVVITVGVSP